MPYFDKLIEKIQQIDFDAVADKIGSVIDWIAEHANVLLGVASVIAGAFVGIKIAGFIKGIVSAIQIISGLVKAFGFMKVALAALGGPVTIIITVVSALVAGFIYLWNNCEGFRNFWINLWNGIKNICSKVGCKVNRGLCAEICSANTANHHQYRCKYHKTCGSYTSGNS